jgi:hypothetical protein
MYVPEFPYTGNQAIIKSDRVILMGDKDAVFIFGNQAIGLSSRNTINLDSREKVTISSPKIELGNNAKALGEPVILGDVLVNQLVNLLTQLTIFCETARKTSYEDIDTIEDFADAADKLYLALPNIQNNIQNDARSNKVFLQKND